MEKEISTVTDAHETPPLEKAARARAARAEVDDHIVIGHITHKVADAR